MLTLEEVVNKLKDRNLMRVAKAVGLSYDTVWRVANGRTTSVSYEVVKLLSDYLTGSAAHG